MILNLSNVLSEQHETIECAVPVEMDVFRCETGSFELVQIGRASCRERV